MPLPQRIQFGVFAEFEQVNLPFFVYDFKARHLFRFVVAIFLMLPDGIRIPFDSFDFRGRLMR
jgi:hypothetical protein